MSRTVAKAVTILAADAADVAAANAAWVSIEGCDEVEVITAFTGTANAHLGRDYVNGNTEQATIDINSNNVQTITDPMGKIRAYCNNVSAGEAITMQIRKVFYN